MKRNEMPKDTVEDVEQIARAISQSVRHYCGKGQYDTLPDCQDAYLDGVDTAIGMMYLDLTGTPKSKGILAQLIEDRDAAYQKGHSDGVAVADSDGAYHSGYLTGVADRDAKARGVVLDILITRDVDNMTGAELADIIFKALSHNIDSSIKQ